MIHTKQTFCAFLLAGTASAGTKAATETTAAWTPPIGIPAPDFGIEQTHLMYVGATFDYGFGPQPYRDAGNGPYTHYVDNTCSSATDSGNPCGTPSTPRLTFPSDPPSGSVIEVHGGPYSYGSGAWQWTLDGTAEQPIFIRGADPSDRPKIVGKEIRLQGRYFVLENLDLENSARPRFVSGTVAHHIAFRNLEFHNHNASSGGAFIVISPAADIVIYGNHIHHNGDYLSTVENDVHGVNIDGPVERIWIVDNEIDHHGGDSVQLKNGARNVYIGRNLMHEDRENAIDIKASRDVIISQNTIYGYRPAGTSDGAAVVGGHEGSQLTWVLFNDISDSDVGIRVNDPAYPTVVYIIGNTIHNIHHHTTDYDPTDLYSPGAAIVTWYSNTLYVTNNTIYDTDAGFCAAGYTNGRYHLTNNIIADLAQPQACHIGIEGSTAAAGSTVRNNLLYQGGDQIRIRWAANTFRDVPQFQAAYPTQAVGSFVGDPALVDPRAGDFKLRPDSPAVDAGTPCGSYQTFQNCYGIGITMDPTGSDRPLGTGYDVGAYEGGGAVAADFDRDGDVDGPDFLVFSSCFNGSDRLFRPGCADQASDFDRDGDVDGFDFLTFTNCWNGSDRLPRCP